MMISKPNKPFATLLEPVDQPLIDWFTQENDWQAQLRAETIHHCTEHQMMSSPEQVRFLRWLLHSMDATRAIEIGVFTGYGTLTLAQALPEEGHLIACESNAQWPEIGRPYWEKAAVAHKIDLRIAPASETLQALLDEGQADHFDFIFIDADKPHYPDYFHLSHRLLRQGGMLVFDNVIQVGDQRVAERQTPGTRAIAALLEQLAQESDYDAVLIPIAQGMLLARKIGR